LVNSFDQISKQIIKGFVMTHKKKKFILSLIILILLNACAGKRPLIDLEEVSPTPRNISQNLDIALVLGAGGSKGAAHIGVIEVLEENGIKPNLIVGSSAGSIVGALYAENGNISEVKSNIINLSSKDLLDFSLSATLQATFYNKAPIQGYKLERLLNNLLKVQTFKDLKIPFIAVATSIKTNSLKQLKSGYLPRSIVASAAIPGIFTPVNMYNDVLVDGAVISIVPVRTARLYKPKVIIAVDISTQPSKDKVTSIASQIYRASHISYYTLAQQEASYADIVIHPTLDDHGSFDSSKKGELIALGREEAIKMLPKIKKIIAEKTH
jgi:NTE family protein